MKNGLIPLPASKNDVLKVARMATMDLSSAIIFSISKKKFVTLKGLADQITLDRFDTYKFTLGAYKLLSHRLPSSIEISIMGAGFIANLPMMLKNSGEVEENGSSHKITTWRTYEGEASGFNGLKGLLTLTIRKSGKKEEPPTITIDSAEFREGFTWKSEIDGKADRSELSNIEGTPTGNVIEEIEPTLVADALRKVPQVLTPEEQAQVKKNIGISKMELFCDLFNAAAGNAGYARITNGEFDCELNKIRLTYEEAAEIMVSPRIRGDYNYTGSNQWLYANSRIRTNLPKTGEFRVSQCQYTFVNAQNLEEVNAGINPLEMCFYECQNLKKISVYQLIGSGSNEARLAYYNCKELSEIYVTTMGKWNVDLEWSPLVSRESFARIIAATPNQVITAGGYAITVHPDVYAKLTDESNAEWYAVLTAAAAKNITFATI